MQPEHPARRPVRGGAFVSRRAGRLLGVLLVAGVVRTDAQLPEETRRVFVDCSALTVTPAEATVPASGGMLDLQIDNPAGCAWLATLSLDASWATITSTPTSSADTTATLTITLARNRSRHARPIKLFVGARGGQWIPITQEGRGRF